VAWNIIDDDTMWYVTDDINNCYKTLYDKLLYFLKKIEELISNKEIYKIEEETFIKDYLENDKVTIGGLKRPYSAKIKNDFIKKFEKKKNIFLKENGEKIIADLRLLIDEFYCRDDSIINDFKSYLDDDDEYYSFEENLYLNTAWEFEGFEGSIELVFEKYGLDKKFLEVSWNLGKYDEDIQFLKFADDEIDKYIRAKDNYIVDKNIIYINSGNADVNKFELKLKMQIFDEVKKIIEREFNDSKRAFQSGLYKYSIIGIYSIIEAILSQFLKKKKEFDAKKKYQEKYKSLPDEIERWDISKLIIISSDLNLIDYKLKSDLLDFKEFRNNIHIQNMRNNDNNESLKKVSIRVYQLFEELIQELSK